MDEVNAPVPAATIEIRSPEILKDHAITATADHSGAFTATVPKDGEYSVSAQKPGYFALKDTTISVATSQDVTLILTTAREVFQSINIHDSLPTTPLDLTQDHTVLSGTEVVDIPYPVTHSLKNAMRLMPGVVQDPQGGVHFHGASENQVQYALNGFNISDPITGVLRTTLSVDGIRELDLVSGSMPAEYGKGSAGVLTIRTESGTDQWRYTSTNFVPGLDFRNGLHVSAWSPRFGVSGPIWKGKAWFSDQFDADFNQAYINGLPNGENRRWGAAGSNLIHTQVNLSPSNILFSDVVVNDAHESRLGLGPLDPVSTTLTDRYRNLIATIKDQYYKNGFVYEVGFGFDGVQENRTPQGHGVPYVLSPFGRSGNYFLNSYQGATRSQAVSNVFLPSFQFWGKHQVKTGVDADWLGYTAHNYRTAYQQVGLTGQVLSQTTFAGNGRYHVPDRQFGSYIADSWEPRDDLRIEVGLREDWDQLTGGAVISPRIGVAYSPLASKRTRMTAGYALTTDTTTLEMFGRSMDQYAITTPFTGGLAQPGWATVYTLGGQHLTLPQFTNFTAGIDQQVTDHVHAGISYLRRRGDNGLTYVSAPAQVAGAQVDAIGLPVGAAYMLTNLRRDSYDSVAFAIRQTFREQFEWMASYTWSRALSNSVLDLNINQPLQILENAGRVPWDTPHRVLSWGYLPLWRDKWAIAYLLDLRSGFPFSIQDQTGRIIGQVDSRRFPMNLDLNLHVERRFLFRGYRFAVRAGINNITDSRNATAVNNVIGSPQYLQFLGYEGRHAVLRIRFFGKP